MILDWRTGRLGCFIEVLDAATGEHVPHRFIVAADDEAGVYLAMRVSGGRILEEAHYRPIRFAPRVELGGRPVPPATRALAALMLERLRAGEDPKWSGVVMASGLEAIEIEMGGTRFLEWVDEGTTVLVRPVGDESEG